MKIFYITPYTSERNRHGFPNIGGAINSTIQHLPDDAYICVRDGDTMFLTSDWGTQIEQIIEANQDYDLITCMTNRVGLKHHCCGEYFFNCSDISEHIAHAIRLKESFGNEVDQGTKLYPITVAPGYCMIFKKSLWQKVGGFPDFDITFDRIFSHKVLKSGGKIGIAKGLYLFHLYRWNEKDPKNSIKHLTK